MNLLVLMLAGAMATATPHAHTMMSTHHAHSAMHSNSMHTGKMHSSAMHSHAMHSKNHMTHSHMMATPTPKP
jgi:hypothetical protein